MRRFKTYLTVEHIKENQRISEMIDLIREYIEKFVDLNEDTEYYERIKNMLPRMQKMDKDRVKAIYQSISAPMLRETCRELFKDHDMDPNSDSKAAIAADQLYQKILDSTDEPGFGIALVKQMQNGQAINTKGLMEDAQKKFIEMDSPAYIDAKGAAKPLLEKIYKWFWSWEPAMGGRAVGGGEMALILCHIGGRKGGEKGTGGDVHWPKEKMMIEMKKAGSAGAGWGGDSNFKTAFAYFKNQCEDAGLSLTDDEYKELGLGKKFKKGEGGGSMAAEKLAASLNEASILLSAAPKKMSDVDINSMWDTICEMCTGRTGNLKFKCVKQGKTNVNDFMHTWVANGIDAYAAKEGHNVIFLFNPQTLKGGAIAGKAGAAGAKFYQLQSGNKGPFDYDWDVSWTQMGYHQYVPRLQLIDKGYSQITPNLNLADVKVRAALSPYLSSIKAYTTDSKGEARKALPGGAFTAVLKKLKPIIGVTNHNTDKNKIAIVKALDSYYKGDNTKAGRLSPKGGFTGLTNSQLSQNEKTAIKTAIDNFKKILEIK